MSYRFSLTQFYRADYKDKIWLFKRPDKRDLFAVSEWLSASVKGSEVWRRRMYKQLLQEFSTTAARSQQMSWMVTVSDKRVCWFEIEEIVAPLSQHRFQSHEVQIHLTAPPELLRDNRAALILWRRVIRYVSSFDTRAGLLIPGVRFGFHITPRIYVQLDVSRVAEARALEKLGFKGDGDWYVL